LFVAAEEADLHTAWQEAAAGAAQHLEAGRFIDYWRRLVALKEPLDRFLDRVLVMAPEPDLRRNRLALCAAVYDLYARAGDMSKLVVTGQERVS
jgi:glycyl-tRNA synthetase beta chain